VRQQPAASAAAADAENVDSSNGQRVGTSYQEEEDLLDADFKGFKQPFQAVLINPGEALLSCGLSVSLVYFHTAYEGSPIMTVNVKPELGECLYHL